MDAAEYDGRWWREPPLALVILIVGLIYFCRLSVLPVVGEEGRWARGAVQMLETGDWIVPRQQGQVFPERPPMTSWTMALVGWVRGEVDPIAIRLPSVLAILATAVLIYAYARLFLTQLGAFAAATVYATLGQVLQVGRHGESEALFALLVTGSLLLWHYGYQRRWSPVRVWLVGYSCMALAALVKGPQAPAYFLAITACYLLCVKRDWRFLCSRGHMAGIFAASVLIGAWQVPFYYMTDWDSVMATWAGLAADRFEFGGLLEHVAIYPFETFACLLPWSPLVVALANRSFRQQLGNASDLTTFLATALLVTYPTVWFASAARGRYFMPLYPCLAVLIGLIIERCVSAQPGSWGRLNWRNFLLGSSIVAATSGVIVLAANCFPNESWPYLAQPPWFAAVFLVAAVASGVTLLKCRAAVSQRTASVAITTLAAFVGLASTGVLINMNRARWNDPTQVITQIKQKLSGTTQLVSFGPVDHRFCYHYRDRIQEVAWPTSIDDVPAGVEYFCIDRHPQDTDSQRLTGRGRTWSRGPGELPFEWEEVARVCVERRLRDQPQPTVIVARIKVPDARLSANGDLQSLPR